MKSNYFSRLKWNLSFEFLSYEILYEILLWLFEFCWNSFRTKSEPKIIGRHRANIMEFMPLQLYSLNATKINNKINSMKHQVPMKSKSCIKLDGIFGWWKHEMSIDSSIRHHFNLNSVVCVCVCIEYSGLVLPISLQKKWMSILIN